ncbi:MAG: cysteine desulfurase, partial [Bacteroidota bacterium]
RGAYDLSAASTDAYEQARAQVAEFIGAKEMGEIIFTRGATEAINLLVNSYFAPRLKAGEEILVSGMEHHANLIPWQELCKTSGAKLRIIPVLEDGSLDQEAFSQLLSKKVKLLGLVHISNSLGTRNPVEEMIRQAKEWGIPVLLDASQSAAHLPLDVAALGCEFLVFSGHKVYGPTGIGALYVQKNLLPDFAPFLLGGDMIRTVSYQSATYAKGVRRLEAGTPHMAGAVGLGRAVQFLMDLGMDQVKIHTEALMAYALPKLTEIPSFRLVGQADPVSGIISFLLGDIHPHDLGTILNEDRIAIRAGNHCTMPLMHHLGVPGTARASFGIYNTKAEIDRLVQSLHRAQAIFA